MNIVNPDTGNSERGREWVCGSHNSPSHFPLSFCPPLFSPLSLSPSFPLSFSPPPPPPFPPPVDSSKPLNLTALSERIRAGNNAATVLRTELPMFKATPVTYLMNGPFGSFAPTYDSAFATLTKMDSDLLLRTYGSDLGVSYSHRSAGTCTCMCMCRYMCTHTHTHTHTHTVCSSL